MSTTKHPESNQSSNQKFKEGMKINILNIRKPTRGGTRL